MKHAPEPWLAAVLQQAEQKLRLRADLGRRVAIECDFYSLPKPAQNALYGIAGELENIADLLGAASSPSCSCFEAGRDPGCSVHGATAGDIRTAYSQPGEPA